MFLIKEFNSPSPKNLYFQPKFNMSLPNSSIWLKIYFVILLQGLIIPFFMPWKMGVKLVVFTSTLILLIQIVIRLQKLKKNVKNTDY